MKIMQGILIAVLLLLVIGVSGLVSAGDTSQYGSFPAVDDEDNPSGYADVVPLADVGSQSGGFVILTGTEADDQYFIEASGELSADESIVGASAADIASEIVRITNNKRISHGKVALTRDTTLDDMASWLSNDMSVSHKFSHTDSLGRGLRGRLLAWSYSYSVAGENIICGFPNSASATYIARSMVNAWMRSPGHRANILNGKFRETGVGCKWGWVKVGGKKYTGWIATQDFAKPL